MPDLVLINPASRARVYQGLATTLSAIEPPVWAGLMATFVRRKGFSVRIIDAEALGLTPLAVADMVKDFKPLLVGIVAYGQQPSASTQVMPAVGDVAVFIKTTVPEQKILILGGHASALPERTLREEPVDFVCDGEGLHTLVDLITGLKTSNMDKSKIRDLWYWDNGRPTRSVARAKLVTDLDHEMPGVAWDLLPISEYRAGNWQCLGGLDRSPYASLYTTLGCPYKCSFCCIQSPFKSGEAEMGKSGINSYRFWSPELVVDQIEMLRREHSVRNFKFADEMFVLNRRHVEEICRHIVLRGLDDLNIWAYARVDTINQETLPLLRSAGFRWLIFGIESASSKVRDGVAKGYDQEDIRTTLDMVRVEGIHMVGNFIFGLPEDNLQTMQETLDLALELNCDWTNFYSAMAYPGSELYKTALEQGWALPDSWSGYSQHSVDTMPLRTKHVSSREVLQFRDSAFKIVNSNPAYLAYVERTFGKVAVQEIKQMLGYDLVRNI